MIKNVTLDLFVDSLVEVIISDLDRIEIKLSLVIDLKTSLQVTIGGDPWIMYVPSHQVGLYLNDEQKLKLEDALIQRENNEFIQIHEKLYKDDQSSMIFSEIQKMRKTCPMVEEAWQNLKTVYALNMDSDG